MSESTNPYQAPQAHTSGQPPCMDWRRAAKLFVGWLIGASLVGGVGLALQIGYALSAFSAEHWVSLIVVVSALRVCGAMVAASAASGAFVVMIHRRPTASTDGRQLQVPWQLYLAVPLAAPLSAFLLIVVGSGVAALVFDVTPAEYWSRIWHNVLVIDLLRGLAAAGLYAVALGAIAAAAGRWPAAMRRGLVTKLIVAWLVTSVVIGVIEAALNSADFLVDPFPEGEIDSLSPVPLPSAR
jgi:ABC-type transporter Mla maintaining outer membrane lipid asymmetry permease subunit MlaE